MKTWMILLLVVLLAGCAAQPPATQQQTQQAPADSNYVEPPKSTVVTPSAPVSTQTRTGKTFYFVMEITPSGYDPDVLTVPWDDRIKITLTNTDSKEHSFDIKELDIAYTLKSKETVVVDFIPKTKGYYAINDRFSAFDGELIVGGET